MFKRLLGCKKVDKMKDFIEFKACKFNEIGEKEMKLVQNNNKEILLVKQEGIIYAIGPKCSHYEAPLINGTIYKHHIRCPWHGACFNLKTGDIEDFPGFSNLPTYEVIVKNDEVWIKTKLADLENNSQTKGKERKCDNKKCFVIVGGGAAGFECSKTLCKEGFSGRIVLISSEDFLPYDRTKLSKLMGNKIDSLYIRNLQYYQNSRIDLQISKKVIALNTESKFIKCSDGSSYNYDKIFLATGVIPRKLTIPGSDLKNICYLRSFNDASYINDNATYKNVVIIGNSFIGMEVASFLSKKAKSIHIVGKSSVPFEQTLGLDFGKKVKELYESKNIKFCNSELVRFEGNETLKKVVCSNQTLDADLCVVGIGNVSNVDYLSESSINMNESGSVLVNDKMETNVEGVYAGGDMVTFPLNTFDNLNVSIGHWQIAQLHGRIAGFSMIGKPLNWKTVPFFWSKLFDNGIRFAGHIQDYDDTYIAGSLNDWKFAIFYLKKEIVVGVCTVGFDPLASAYANLLSHEKVLQKKDILDSDPSNLTSLLVNF